MTKLLNTKEACNYLGLDLKAFYNYRSHKKGPKVKKIKGRELFFDGKDLDDWNERRKIKKLKRMKIKLENPIKENDTNLTPLLDDLAALIAKYEKKIFKDKDVLNIFNILFSQLVSIYHVIRRLEEKVK